MSISVLILTLVMNGNSNVMNTVTMNFENQVQCNQKAEEIRMKYASTLVRVQTAVCIDGASQ